MIGRAGIGVDNVDIPAATARGIIVMNTPFGNSITTAEHAITLMLALARQIPEADASTQAGKWEKNRFMGVEIFGKTLGIIGCGNIGSIVADRALGLKMKVIAYDPFLSAERAVDLGVEKVELDELLRARRFHHAAHAAHRQDPQHHRRRRRWRRPRRACASSIARAAAWSTRRRWPRRCNRARSRAPRSTCSPRSRRRRIRCSALPNVVCTPHLGASTSEAQENVALQVAEQMSDYLLRGAITNAVNFPSISAEEAPKLKPFVALAEKLGSFAGQLTETGIKRVQIAYEGVVAQMNTRALTSAAVAGLLRPMLQDVNVVSAPIVAKERGIVVEETRARGRRRLREPDHGDGDDRAADAPRLRHRVRRRAPAHRQHQGHPHGRRVRPLDDLHHQSGQAGLHRPVLARRWARPASTSPPSMSAARRRAATPSR